MTTEFTFDDLRPELAQAVAELGYTEPTPIQAAIIPLMLTVQDVIGQAQTGTGKTAAFALPILQIMQPGSGSIQSLVVTPTRELAIQVARAFHDFGHVMGLRVLAIYGGQPYDRQKRRLSKGVDVVVGTPGRLLDLIGQRALDLSELRTVVLDEADEMLSMGFIEDIEAILAETPTTRQTALFSATMPTEIRQLADKYMFNPQVVSVGPRERTVAAIEQRSYLVHPSDKLAALTRIFEMEDITSALIFTRTRASTGELASELTVRGFPAESLNGDLSQDAREQVMQRFRRGQTTVLVATDVAARGLDIDDISHVFNYDLPLQTEAYVHRIGRTGRAGKNGVAISLVTPDENWRLLRIERFTRQSITRADLPTVAEIEARREALLQEKLLVWLRRGRCRREKEIVVELVEAGHDPLDIAAVALKMGRSEEKQRPIAEIREVNQSRPAATRHNDRPRREYDDRPDRPRRERDSAPRRERTYGRQQNGDARGSHEEGMVRLTLSAGRAQGIRPNDVVGTIAYHADIPGRSIGAIRIQEDHTLVDVPQQFVGQILDKAGSYRIRQQTVTLTRS